MAILIRIDSYLAPGAYATYWSLQRVLSGYWLGSRFRSDTWSDDFEVNLPWTTLWSNISAVGCIWSMEYGLLLQDPIPRQSDPFPAPKNERKTFHFYTVDCHQRIRRIASRIRTWTVKIRGKSNNRMSTPKKQKQRSLITCYICITDAKRGMIDSDHLQYTRTYYFIVSKKTDLIKGGCRFQGAGPRRNT